VIQFNQTDAFQLHSDPLYSSKISIPKEMTSLLTRLAYYHARNMCSTQSAKSL